jgi:hypothetical protein
MARTHARRHTIKVGADKYRVGKKATRAVVKTATSKAVTTTKKAGGSISRTITKSATGAKGFRIGKYARSGKGAAPVVNSDGSTTYTTKNGGTKTVKMSVTGTPKKKGTTTTTPPKDDKETEEEKQKRKSYNNGD